MALRGWSWDAAIPFSDGNSDNRAIPRSAFVYDGATDTYRCPNGATLRRCGRTTTTAAHPLDVVRAGMNAAAVIVVWLTPDERVELTEQVAGSSGDRDAGFQPRPNVLLEAGMALAESPGRTILVKIGQVREVSDISGINYVSASNDPGARHNLALRLKTAGCDTDLSGEYQDVHTAGDFDRAIHNPEARASEDRAKPPLLVPLRPDRSRKKLVEWRGVRWQVDKRWVPNPVLGPFCPEDGTFLAQQRHGRVEVKEPEMSAWEYVKHDEMTFVCLKCDAHYDLRGSGDMKRAWNILRSITEQASTDG
jgi:hypothetical protein